MTVARIIRNKGRDIVTIQPDRTLKQAADLLAARRIGAVLVVGSDERLIGILSERDIVRAVAARGEAGLGQSVRQHMTEGVMTCTGATTIGDLMTMMTQGKFRHVPVLEAGRLAGIVSIGDVVKERLEEMEAEGRALRDYIATA